MEPAEFRLKMEQLAKQYDLPHSFIQPMIYELGIISQKCREERGKDYQEFYLAAQYQTFKTRLADPQFAAGVKRSVVQRCQELDSEE